ncbi:MAG: iron chelate uptake ABC transporter family permease subunit, partial [Rhodospirillum sp.]|nr:iron chelate uptake ABC transporter family permease subunit [Rhodospirillum sp.]
MDNGHPAGLALARWPRPQGPMAVALPLAFVALSLTLWNLSDLLPLTLWGRGTFAPELADFRQMVFHHARLPRLAMALLAGGALGLSGILYQLVLRNPLAEPTTLGVSAGAQLALGAAMVTAPGLLAEGREGVALGGGLVSALLVFGLSLGRGMAPLTLILAGMIVGYYASTIGSVLVLFNHGTLSELFVWQSGVLSQTGWLDATRLAPRLLLAGGIAALMIRPLTLLGLDEAGARGLGLGLGKTRLAGLAVATALAAVVVAPVGVIGFVGLAAPSVARLSGARLVSQRLVWSTGFGALLLWITDQSVLAAGRFGPEIPTGVATAALGAPFLLWLMRRVRSGTVEGRSERAVGALSRPGLGLVVLLGLLVLVVWGALSLGRGAGG